MSVPGGSGQREPLLREMTPTCLAGGLAEWTTPVRCPVLWGGQVGVPSLLKGWLKYQQFLRIRKTSIWPKLFIFDKTLSVLSHSCFAKAS